MTERRPETESELVELVRSIDVPAPDSLRRHVESLVAERASASPFARARASITRWRSPTAGRRAAGSRHSSTPARVAAAGAIVAAALAVALTIALAGGGGGGSSGPLNVREASALALRPATARAPSQSAADRGELAAAVDGVAFPYWEDRFGWRSTGARTDRVAGRTVTTVFYADSRGHRIGYGIVAGTPAPRVSGGVVAWRAHRPYRVLSVDGMQVVTWLRNGVLCVVSGRGVSRTALLDLVSAGGGAQAA